LKNTKISIAAAEISKMPMQFTRQEYGFLSENSPKFPEFVLSTDIKFIGANRRL